MFGLNLIFSISIQLAASIPQPLEISFTRSQFAMSCESALTRLHQISPKGKNANRYILALVEAVARIPNKKVREELIREIEIIGKDYQGEFRNARSPKEQMAVAKEAVIDLELIGQRAATSLVKYAKRPPPRFVSWIIRTGMKFSLMSPISRLKPKHDSWPVFDDEWNELSAESKVLPIEIQNRTREYFSKNSAIEFLRIDELANSELGSVKLARLFKDWNLDVFMQKSHPRLGINEIMPQWVEDPLKARKTYSDRQVSMWWVRDGLDEYFKRLFTYALEHGKAFKPRRSAAGNWILAMPTYQFKIHTDPDGKIRNLALAFHREDELIRMLPEDIEEVDPGVDPYPGKNRTNVVSPTTMPSIVRQDSKSEEPKSNEAHFPLPHEYRQNIPENIVAVLDKIHHLHSDRRELVQLMALHLEGLAGKLDETQWVQVVREIKSKVRSFNPDSPAGVTPTLIDFEYFLRQLSSGQVPQALDMHQDRPRTYLDVLSEKGVSYADIKSEMSFEEIKKLLEKLGYNLARESKHYIFENPKASRPKPIPRKPRFAANYVRSVLRDSGKSLLEWEESHPQ